MIATDENALVCDLAETYHIYDYKSLPISKVATFSVGLRENSRIKMKMNGMKHSFNTILLAGILDKLSILIWMQTKDASKGINQPNMLVKDLLGEKDEKDLASFDTPEDFEKEWRKLIEGSENRWEQN